MKYKLKAPRSKRLKLRCNILLSTSNFNLNLRRYSMGLFWCSVVPVEEAVTG